MRYVIVTSGQKGVQDARQDPEAFGRLREQESRRAAEVCGVEVDPLTRALCTSPGDQGKIPGFRGRKDGRLRLVYGSFPAEGAVKAAVGGGYDLFISKNTLKRGYIHPYRPAPDPTRLIQLEVSDDDFLRAVYDTLAPGGWFCVDTPRDYSQLQEMWKGGKAPWAVWQ